MSAISAASAGQFTKVRSKRQAAQLYAVAIKPAIVFAAQINGTPTTRDKVVSIPFDNVTVGAYTDIVPNMLLWVGSQPGTYDIGFVRLRSATSTILTIGEESELALSDGQYLSGLYDFQIWPIHPRVISDGTAYMDGNIAYSDQHLNFSPHVIMGTHAVKKITGASVSSAWDASESWCEGATITSYAWTCPGATIDDATSATPSIDFDHPDQYLVSCTVTASNGKTGVGRRWAVVWSPFDYYETGTQTVSRARTSDVATLVATGHGLSNNDVVSVSGLDDDSYNIEHVTVTVVNPNTITYPCVGDDEATEADTGGEVRKLIYLATPPIKLASFDCSVDYQRGGVEFSIRAYADATTEDIYERALLIVFAEDYYDGVLGSVGQIADRENVVCVGWINSEDLTADINGGTVDFSAAGPQYWLDNETSFPVGIENVVGTAAAWTQAQNLTLNKAWSSYNTYRSTLAQICDVYPIVNALLTPSCEAGTGSIWAQMTEFIERQILARPGSDQYGRVFAEVDTQYVPTADRSGIPTIMTLEKSDILERIDLERVVVSPVSRVSLSGISYAGDSPTALALFSIAPGRVWKRYGSPETVDRLLLSDQAQANELAGMILAQRNNPYPRFTMQLSSNNRLISVFPRQMLEITITSAMTPRGITYSGKVIPREVSFSYQNGSLLTSLECEAETFADIAMNGEPPVTEFVDGEFVITEGEWPLSTFPSTPNATSGGVPAVVSTPPGLVPTGPCGATTSYNSYPLNWSRRTITGLDTNLSSIAAFPCRLRPAAYLDGNSFIVLNGRYYGDAEGKIQVYGRVGGSRVIQGTVLPPSGYATRVNFSPASELDVEEFELVLDGGGAIESYVIGSLVASGTVQANNGTGISVPLVIGQYYAVQNDGTAWNSGIGIAYGVIFIDQSELSRESAGTNITRVYYLASATTGHVTVWDFKFDDNSGSSGYFVYNVTPIGARKLVIDNCRLYSVCGYGG